MTDINARIAKKKYPAIKFDHYNTPPYTTDWRLAGELIEEVGHKSSVTNVQADLTG